MKNDDDLKKSLEELMNRLEQNGDNLGRFDELKLQVRGALDSLNGESSAKNKITPIKPELEKRRDEEHEYDEFEEEDGEYSYEELISGTVDNILEKAKPTIVFVETLDDIDKKSMKKAVAFTRECIAGPDCTADDIIAVAATFSANYFLEGMVFSRYGVYWKHRENNYYIEYADVEAVLVPKSESTVSFGDDIMLIERYSNDEIAVPFNRMLYNNYRAIGDMLTELNKIAREYAD